MRSCLPSLPWRYYPTKRHCPPFVVPFSPHVTVARHIFQDLGWCERVRGSCDKRLEVFYQERLAREMWTTSSDRRQSSTCWHPLCSDGRISLGGLVALHVDGEARARGAQHHMIRHFALSRVLWGVHLMRVSGYEGMYVCAME